VKYRKIWLSARNAQNAFGVKLAASSDGRGGWIEGNGKTATTEQQKEGRGVVRWNPIGKSCVRFWAWALTAAIVWQLVYYW